MQFTIKQARQYSGLTQRDMAKQLDVALPTYRNFEHNESTMRVDTAKKFSEIVKIPMENIFFCKLTTRND